MGAPVDFLFSRDVSPAAPKVGVIPLALGADTGIRDLAALGDGRLLVLTGPAQDQTNVAHGVFLVDPRTPGSLQRLATLTGIEQGGKAEGADSGRSRPGFRNDVAHPFRDDVAHHSEMMPPGVPE